MIAAAAGTVAVVAAVTVGLAATLGGGSDHGTDNDGPGTPTTSASPGEKPGKKPAPFLDEFTTALGAGWSWTNENAGAWRISPTGWLEIDSQESPPKHNLLLRDVPGASYQIKVRLRFPATAAGFAGLVLMGDDPETWLEFGLTDEGLSLNEYTNGRLVVGSMMYTRDLHVAANRDIRLILAVDGDHYLPKYYDREYDSYTDFGPEQETFKSTYTRVGLMVYRSTGAAGTAAFDSLEIY
jgi:hypothetical protein